MVIVNWKQGVYSMQSWGKIGHPCGFGEMLIGDNFLGYFNDKFGVYQRRKGRKKRIIVKQIYCRPRDPKTPAQLASRFYMRNINEIFDSLSVDELAILQREANKNALNRFTIHARYMQLQRPTQIGAMQMGFSFLGSLDCFVNTGNG